MGFISVHGYGGFAAIQNYVGTGELDFRLGRRFLSLMKFVVDLLRAVLGEWQDKQHDFVLVRKESGMRKPFILLLVTLLLTGLCAAQDSAGGFSLAKSIPMLGVQGKFDHSAVDVKGKRLFV